MNMFSTLPAAALAAVLSLPLASAAVTEAPAQAIAAPAPLSLAAGDAMDDAGDAVSDTWITTKVKSVLLADDSTPGLDIEVETKDGVVSLSGTVATEAQREKAIADTKGIKGVRDVAADGLKALE